MTAQIEQRRTQGEALFASRSVLNHAHVAGGQDQLADTVRLAAGSNARTGVLEKKPEPEGQPTDLAHLQQGDIVKVFRTTTLTRRHVWAKIKILKPLHQADGDEQVSVQVLDWPFGHKFGLGYLFVFKKNQLYITKNRSDRMHYHYELLERSKN